MPRKTSPSRPHSRYALATAALALSGFAHAGILDTVRDKVAGALVDRAVDHAAERARDPVAVPAPVAFPAGAGFAGCSQVFPAGQPLSVGLVHAQWRPVALCANAYAVVYSGLTKTPLVVVERLNRQQLADARDEQRTDEFFPDPRLPHSARAELDDYKGSGLDRGHLAAAANQPDRTAMAQSFALSNMVPQDPTHNRKVWSKVESDVRKFARRAAGNVFVYSGPLFLGPKRTIGRGEVWVPSHLFKLVFDEASGRSWAYVLANTRDAQLGPPMDYPSFVRQTGWRLLPLLEESGG